MFLPLALLSSVLILGTNGLPVRKDEVFPGIGRYLYDPQARNWTEAMTFCNVNKGELVVINSEAEKNAVKTIMAKNGARSVHMGFHSLYTPEEFITIHDEPLYEVCGGVSQWAPGFPTGDEGSNCGAFKMEGYLDTSCNHSESVGTICEYPKWSEFQLVPEVGHYKYHEEKVNFTEARDVCQEEGGHVYVINSKVEREAVYAHFNYSEIWVGVHRHFSAPDTSEKYVDIFNNKMETESGFWAGGFPNGNVKTKPYVVIYRGGFNGHSSASAELLRPFICEVDL